MVRWVAVASVIGALSSSGCTDRACVRWGEHEGECPTQEEALEFMGYDPECKEKIVSVDSAPEKEEEPSIGTLCCYDVTKEDLGGDGYSCGMGIE